MILRFYPQADSTIYELYPEKNAGLDAILDISKVISSTSSYNSRVVLNFDWDSINSLLTQRQVSPDSCSFTLKLYNAESREIPLNYALECYPIAQEWAMGVGRYGNLPETVVGVSWMYRTSAETPSSVWMTGSYPATVTGSWSVQPGGGTWYTTSLSTQSFNYEVGDISMDVSEASRLFLSNGLSRYGFIIKKSDQDEASSDLFSSIKFFSRETSTIYSPILEVGYDDSVYTGSLTDIDASQDLSVTVKNLRDQYTQGTVATLRIGAHYLYANPTFTTASLRYDDYRLPSGSQYAIYNAHTDDPVIEWSDYTLISANDQGNFFKLDLAGFQPERFYRIKVRIPDADVLGAYQEVFDKQWIFKVKRA